MSFPAAGNTSALHNSPEVHPRVEGADERRGDEPDERHVDDHEDVPADLRRHRAAHVRQALGHGQAPAVLVAQLVQDVVDGGGGVRVPAERWHPVRWQGGRPGPAGDQFILFIVRYYSVECSHVK